MHRNCFAAVLSSTVLAGAIGLSGCAAGPPSTTAAKMTSATKAGQAEGPVHVVFYSVNSDGPDFRVIATGAVGDYGPAVTVHPDGTVDPQHTSELELKLVHGSFRLSIASLDKKIGYATGHWPKYSPTSSFHLSVTAPVPIVAGSGTGSYRGISGNLTMTAVIDEVDKTHSAGSGFLAQLIAGIGSGTVSFG